MSGARPNWSRISTPTLAWPSITASSSNGDRKCASRRAQIRALKPDVRAAAR